MPVINILFIGYHGEVILLLDPGFFRFKRNSL